MKLSGIPESGLRRIAKVYTTEEYREFEKETKRNLERLKQQVRSVGSFDEHYAAAKALLAEWDRELDFEEDAAASGIYSPGSMQDEAFSPAYDLYPLTRELGQDYADRRWGDAHDDPAYQEVISYLSGFSGGNFY